MLGLAVPAHARSGDLVNASAARVRLHAVSASGLVAKADVGRCGDFIDDVALSGLMRGIGFRF